MLRFKVRLNDFFECLVHACAAVAELIFAYGFEKAAHLVETYVVLLAKRFEKLLVCAVHNSLIFCLLPVLLVPQLASWHEQEGLGIVSLRQ